MITGGVLLGLVVVVILWGITTGYPDDLFNTARVIPYHDAYTKYSASMAQFTDLTQGELKVKFGGGWFSLIGEQTLDDIWYTAICHGPQLARPSSYYREGSDSILWEIKQGKGTWWTNSDLKNHWAIELSPELHWKLDIALGNSGAEFDLDHISVDTLSLNLVRSHMMLTVSEARENFSHHIRATNSKINLVLPQNTSATVTLRGIFYGSNLEELGWKKQGATYYSPHHTNDGQAIHLQMNLYFSQLILGTQM